MNDHRVTTIGQGIPLRVISSDMTVGILTAIATTGKVFQFRIADFGDGNSHVKPSDIILYDGNAFTICTDPAIFEEQPEILTVRCVYDDGFLAEYSNMTQEWKTVASSSTDLRAGMTIAYFPFSKTFRVLEEKPIPRLDSSNETNAGSFRIHEQSTLHYSDFGGYPQLVHRIATLFDVQFKKRKFLQQIGVKPLTGLLFTGDPGTGKTFLGRIIASEVDVPFYLISGPEVITKWVGDSEDTLRKIFKEAQEQQGGAIIFFDEIDSLAAARQNNPDQHDTRLIGQLLTLMDGFSEKSKVMVIASTNRAAALDPALKRSGRFDRFEVFGLPDVEDRIDILIKSGRNMSHADMPIEEIALQTEGFSPADLCEIWSEAGQYAAAEERDTIQGEDFIEGFLKVSTSRVRKEECSR